MKPIVFLHIPKTAGQTIHHQLSALVGQDNVSPIRIHAQAKNAPQMPEGYLLYSGHLDWIELDNLPKEKFVFTVLRDPKERIASFYFFLLKQAKELSEEEINRPKRYGMRNILHRSTDDYFFGGDNMWQKFVLDHYDNFYCSYFATGLMRGHSKISMLSTDDLIEMAQMNAQKIDRIYTISDLVSLEDDIERQYGRRIMVAGNFQNKGQHRVGEQRWPKLLDRFETDTAVRQIEQFADKDELLMQKMGIVF